MTGEIHVRDDLHSENARNEKLCLTDAVIMTGGRGTRLAPYTKVLPKGLLPVGDLPILEIIVRQLAQAGFCHMIMACGYLAGMIQTYFQDGSKWGIDIHYLVEEEPLGTIGPLKRVSFQKPVLVMNCDVLTSLDFCSLATFHREKEAVLTVASQKKEVPLHFGVLETEGDRVIRLLEKPQQSALVSMGVYMMNPEVREYISHGYYDVPDLIRALLKDKHTVRHYMNDSYWVDIGQPDDFMRANEEFAKMRSVLLPERSKKGER